MVNREVSAALFHGSIQQALEVSAVLQACDPHHMTAARNPWGADAGCANVCGATQTCDRRLRPLARRALMTARPPRVFIRTRKPCVRARRVLDG